MHTTQAALDLHEDWVDLLVDCANAFNSVSRAAVIAQVLERFPELFALVWACYEIDLFLVYGVVDDVDAVV